MTKTIISDGNSRLIALMCASERDLGNICKCFYDEFQTPDRCSYAAQHQLPKMQMVMMGDGMPPTPRPCMIYAINGGNPIPMNHQKGKSNSSDRYYYDFAIVGQCREVNACVDAFIEHMALSELPTSSYMLEPELLGLMDQYHQHCT